MSVIDVVSGDRLRLHCSVSYADYFGYLTPHYHWSVLAPDDERQRVQITSPAAENSGVAYVMASWPTVPDLLCFVHFNSSAGSKYSDAASNAPSYRGNCTTNAINVLSPPRDVLVADTATDSPGSRHLLCSAAGRPAPSYEWYRVSGTGDKEDQMLASGELLTLTDIGRHQVRCMAVNVIRRVTHRIASNTVVVNVLPPHHDNDTRDDNDTDTVTDFEIGRSRNNESSMVASVNETSVYRGNTMLRRIINSPYFVPGTCAVAVVLLAVPTVVAIVICCRRRTKQHGTNAGVELATTTTSTWTSSNMQASSQQSGELSEHGNELTVDDERMSTVYDEIAPSSESAPPSPAASEQYNKLILSDVAPVVAPATSVGVYSRLQRDANNAIRKITIAVGKCDVSIVFNGDDGTSIERMHADSAASLGRF